MDSTKVKELLGILVDALHAGIGRSQKVAEFQRLVWEEPADATDPAVEILKDLAYDLDFYVSSPAARREDQAFYDDERFAAEVDSAFQKLREIGIAVPEKHSST